MIFEKGEQSPFPSLREMTMDSPVRSDILHDAVKLTCGDRNDAYGPPWNNLTDCAQLWEAYLNAKYGTVAAMQLTAEDVAWMNVLQKISRTFRAQRVDNYVDAAAYAAIAGECRLIEDTQ